ncbi:hypothetical protein BC749_11253 [Flavobacterium araucananum]|nr:hypothetical protein BC749_11253 [Flavobacterium araucananum]
MKNIYNLKILIVGLTTVLSLISYTKNDFRKDLCQNQDLSFNKIK